MSRHADRSHLLALLINLTLNFSPLLVLLCCPFTLRFYSSDDYIISLYFFFIPLVSLLRHSSQHSQQHHYSYFHRFRHYHHYPNITIIMIASTQIITITPLSKTYFLIIHLIRELTKIFTFSINFIPFMITCNNQFADL